MPFAVLPSFLRFCFLLIITTTIITVVAPPATTAATTTGMKMGPSTKVVVVGGNAVVVVLVVVLVVDGSETIGSIYLMHLSTVEAMEREGCDLVALEVVVIVFYSSAGNDCT